MTPPSLTMHGPYSFLKRLCHIARIFRYALELCSTNGSTRTSDLVASLF